MFENDIINKVIKDNIKINEIEDFKKENILKDNDNSFNQLYSLQLLIQKQSGLKELCK